MFTEEGKQHARAANFWGGCGKGVEPRDRPFTGRVAEKQRPAPIAVGYTARGMKSPRMSLRQNLLPYAYGALVLRIITVPTAPAAAAVTAFATAVVPASV